MARLGISSVSVYRATKGFSAIGLDRDVAELYGVQSTLGGLSMRDVARILLTNHRFVLEEGLGKYQWIDQVCFHSKISKFFLIDFVCICLPRLQLPHRPVYHIIHRQRHFIQLWSAMKHHTFTVSMKNLS